MGLQKPQKSKAPAPTEPAGGYHSQGSMDPCCIPGGVTSDPIEYNTAGDSGLGGADWAMGHILPPTAH